MGYAAGRGLGGSQIASRVVAVVLGGWGQLLDNYDTFPSSDIGQLVTCDNSKSWCQLLT